MSAAGVACSVPRNRLAFTRAPHKYCSEEGGRRAAKHSLPRRMGQDGAAQRRAARGAARGMLAAMQSCRDHGMTCVGSGRVKSVRPLMAPAPAARLRRLLCRPPRVKGPSCHSGVQRHLLRSAPTPQQAAVSGLFCQQIS